MKQQCFNDRYDLAEGGISQFRQGSGRDLPLGTTVLLNVRCQEAAEVTGKQTRNQRKLLILSMPHTSEIKQVIAKCVIYKWQLEDTVSLGLEFHTGIIAEFALIPYD